ncbi:MAG: carboxypeptidase-like regulatory domain-containing protein [Flavobacteriales bacterium]|jgi:hypothetical protein
MGNFRSFVLVCVGCLAAAASAFAQPAVVQVSGMVVTGDSLSPLPYATVYRTRDQRGTTTDFNGFFSLPALAGDTLTISTVGFVSRAVVVPDVSDRFNAVLPLVRDTVVLGTAVINPWPSQERFRQEFMALTMAPDAYSIANERLDPVALFDRLSYIEPDAIEVGRTWSSAQATAASTQGMIPTVSVLNPAAWAAFIRALRNGELRQ